MADLEPAGQDKTLPSGDKFNARNQNPNFRPDRASGGTHDITPVSTEPTPEVDLTDWNDPAWEHSKDRDEWDNNVFGGDPYQATTAPGIFPSATAPKQ